MWLTKTIALLFPGLTLGLSDEAIRFSVDYFKERHIPFVCLISCNDDLNWVVKFTKASSSRFIAVSDLNTRSLSDQRMLQCFRQHYTSIGVLMDAGCGNTEQLFYFASENQWLDSTHFWLIVDDNDDLKNNTAKTNIESENAQNKIEILKNLNISVDADIIMAIKNNETFFLYDIFNFGKIQGGSLIINETGYWNVENGFVADLNGYKYYRRWDFGNWTMRIMSVVTFPKEQFNPKMLENVRPIPGIAPVTVTSSMCLFVVAEIHNISFLHTVGDRWVGPLNRSYTELSVLTALYYGTQDVSSMLRMYPAFNFDVVTYLQPHLTYLETKFYYRILTSGAGKFENQFLRPLSPGAWLGVLAICILCAIILLGTAKLEARRESIQYSVFSVVAIFCQQFFEDEYQRIRVVSSARKQILFVTGMSCVLVYNYYTSSVVSWLLSAPPPSLTSLEELLHSPLEMIFQDVGYTRSWLYTPGYYYNMKHKAVEDELRQKALTKKSGTPLMLPLKEGIAKVKAGGFAYHSEIASADDLISRTFNPAEMCELGTLSSINKGALYAVAQRNSPYREFFSWSFKRISERGIISSIQRRTTPNPVGCQGIFPRALALGGAAPAFVMLVYGYMLSVVIMLFERFTYKCSAGVATRKIKVHSKHTH